MPNKQLTAEEIVENILELEKVIKFQEAIKNLPEIKDIPNSSVKLNRSISILKAQQREIRAQLKKLNSRQ
ncbi:MAG: hypothetical protein M1273_08750 [Deltaproteobacteria bacterium]|jgi:hypothetical protein|nr:hypothetical protein [Deltaproteobacteria bacterium]